MVAQNHGFVIAEVGHQPLALADIVGDAFKVVIGDVQKPHRGLRQRQQPAFHRRDRHAGRGVGMRDAVDIVAGHMNGAVNDKAGGVDAIVGGIEEGVAVEVDLDQAGRIDFLVEHPVRVDQEMIGRSRNAAGDVVGDHLGHAVQRGEAIAGGEIDPGLPFLRADLLADRFDDLDRG